MSNSRYAVKLSTDLNIDIVEKKPTQGLLDFCYDAIGCRYVEHVNARHLLTPYTLMIDEEGRLKDKPMVNFIASYLYGAHEHHEPIVGNVLVMKIGMTEEGPDILLLSEEEAQKVFTAMRMVASVAYKKVSDALEISHETEDRE